jgi:hypothetical protein
MRWCAADINKLDEICADDFATVDNEAAHWCLALTYHRLARPTAAEAALNKLRVAAGDRWACRGP